MKQIFALSLSLLLVACGGGGGSSNSSSNTVAVQTSTFPCITSVPAQAGKYRAALIDIPHDHAGVTSAGIVATSFENVKLTVDRAKCVGFDTVILQTFIPIDPATGLLTSAVGSDLPRDYWKIVEYAKSKGLRVVGKMAPSDYRDDSLLHSSNYPNIPVTVMLGSMDSYYKEIAAKAEIYKIDVLTIGYFQMGFDTLPYKQNWQSIVSNVKSVYTGKLTYATCLQCINNVVWDLVDIVSIDFEPSSTPSCSSTVSQIIPYYQQSVDVIKTLAQTYQKPIWLDEMDFETVGCNFAGNSTYSLLMSGQLTASYTPNYSWQSNNIRAAFEIAAGSLNGVVSGMVFGTYMPWIQADWAQHPNTDVGKLFNAFDKLGYSLYNNDQAQFTFEEYLGKPWGYRIYY